MRWGEAREGWKVERAEARSDGDGGQEKSELEPQERTLRPRKTGKGWGRDGSWRESGGGGEGGLRQNVCWGHEHREEV